MIDEELYLYELLVLKYGDGREGLCVLVGFCDDGGLLVTDEPNQVIKDACIQSFKVAKASVRKITSSEVKGIRP